MLYIAILLIFLFVALRLLFERRGTVIIVERERSEGNWITLLFILLLGYWLFYEPASKNDDEQVDGPLPHQQYLPAEHRADTVFQEDAYTTRPKPEPAQDGIEI